MVYASQSPKCTFKISRLLHPFNFNVFLTGKSHCGHFFDRLFRLHSIFKKHLLAAGRESQALEWCCCCGPVKCGAWLWFTVGVQMSVRQHTNKQHRWLCPQYHLCTWSRVNLWNCFRNTRMYELLPRNNNTLWLKYLVYLLCLPNNLLLSVPLCLGCYRKALWVPILTHNKRCVSGFEIHYAEYSRNDILAEYLVSKIGGFVPLHILSMPWSSAHPEWSQG